MNHQTSIIFITLFCIVHQLNAELSVNNELDQKVNKLKSKLNEYETKVLRDTNECVSAYYNVIENLNQSVAALSFLVKRKTNQLFPLIMC